MPPHRINILLVEQDCQDPGPIRAELERAGYEPVLERVHTRTDYLGSLYGPPDDLDLVLLDDPLPGISVHEALQLLQTKPRYVPMIVLGTPQNGEAFDYIRLGAADYVQKSAITRLGLAVKRVLSVQEQRENLNKVPTRLLSTYDAFLNTWVHALAVRDPETLEHTHRVTDLSLKLAAAMGLEGDILIHMGRGALLHDIGKIGVPDDILLKPGPLTSEERRIIELHPVFANAMLSPIDFLRESIDIPYCHHERWDGSGYPRGLAGEAIPLTARIFAVADVWDALNSSRPYRESPWPRPKILAYIADNAGTFFDPHVVDAFLELMRHLDTD